MKEAEDVRDSPQERLENVSVESDVARTDGDASRVAITCYFRLWDWRINRGQHASLTPATTIPPAQNLFPPSSSRAVFSSLRTSVMSSVDGVRTEVTEIINLTDNPDTLPSSAVSQDPITTLAGDPTPSTSAIGSSLSSAYDSDSFQAHVVSAEDGPADGRSSDADKMFQSTIDGSSTSEQQAQQEGELGELADGSVMLMQANGVDIGDHATGSDDGRQWDAEEGHDLKRVKVYELIGARWVDQGTAFCFGDFHDGEALLIARSESNYDQIILTTSIKPTDVYQRQQGFYNSFSWFSNRQVTILYSRHAYRMDGAGWSRLRTQLSGPRGLCRGVEFYPGGAEAYVHPG